MSELSQVLRHLLPVDDPNALVDASSGDDAAVYLIADDRALVTTLDFFSPVVDDPRDFGRIAAANALSDIYAMGARPLFALNLLAFPRSLLGEGVVEEIITGGSEIAREAGIAILGGHSIDDPEPKYGMVCVGEVDPRAMITNANGRPGNRLVLTKPLGIGVITTAQKADAAPPTLLRRAVEQMATLNRAAAEIAVTHQVRAGTDVTGYGLLGHLRALCRASGLAAEIDLAEVPVLDGVRELAEAGHVPGGTKRNARDLDDDVSFDPAISPTDRILLADAQTSGGLLLAVPEDQLVSLLDRMDARGVPARPIGRLVEGEAGKIRVG